MTSKEYIEEYLKQLKKDFDIAIKNNLRDYANKLCDEIKQSETILKDLEQKEYIDRKNADLLETINCIKNHAMIKKTKNLGSEIIVSFHSSDKDFEKVGWVFGIIK